MKRCFVVLHSVESNYNLRGCGQAEFEKKIPDDCEGWLTGLLTAGAVCPFCPDLARRTLVIGCCLSKVVISVRTDRGTTSNT